MVLLFLAVKQIAEQLISMPFVLLFIFICPSGSRGWCKAAAAADVSVQNVEKSESDGRQTAG